MKKQKKHAAYRNRRVRESLPEMKRLNIFGFVMLYAAMKTYIEASL